MDSAIPHTKPGTPSPFPLKHPSNPTPTVTTSTPLHRRLDGTCSVVNHTLRTPWHDDEERLIESMYNKGLTQAVKHSNVMVRACCLYPSPDPPSTRTITNATRKRGYRLGAFRKQH